MGLPMMIVASVTSLWSGRLGGVVVSVLATKPKVHGFKPCRGDGFLRAIKTALHLPVVGR
jgi:hypothetical protein